MSKMDLAPGVMKQTAEKIGEDIIAWNKTVREIYSLVDELGHMWEGPGKNAFLKTFEDDREKYIELEKLMTRYKQAIDDIVIDTKRTEDGVMDILSKR